MDKLIMGIDGGGTKSHLCLFDMQGNCRGIYFHGPLNHESLEGSFAQLETELSEFILGSVAQSGADISDVVYGVFGIAGVDTTRQHQIISDILRRIGLTKFTLCNDAYLGVAAGCPDGIGICAINGTGSVLAAIDHSNRMAQVGGIGEVSNDCGGGGWFGVQLLGAVYGELFKDEPPTVMTDMIFELLGITNGSEYTETVIAKLDDESISVGDLNRLVFVAAGAGDNMALDILRRSAAHYTGGIVHLANTLDFSVGSTVHVTFAGSVFIKESIKLLPQMIEAQVRERLSDRTVDFFSLDAAPVAGAVYWAGHITGANIPMDKIKKALAKANL
ncbi:MAG: hypothetical protein LBV33_06105 [Lachnospiraceae bacterium]|jgi:N-acetylglucosamine kinase-like BadF-type ATPase|nr:hypothetical protein [Lachnospiraceae bacterium]